MVFIYTFAVGGGSGTVRPFPNWALVSVTIGGVLGDKLTNVNRTQRGTRIIASD